MSEPFRTAQPSETAPQASDAMKSDVSVAKSDSTPGLYTYKALKGQPYTVEAFNLKNFYEHPDYEQLKEQADTVDDWVQRQARKRGLEDKPESYQEIIDEILKQIGKSENEKPYRTFERVQKAISAINRLEEAKIKPVLDVHNLTADEYKETLPDES